MGLFDDILKKPNDTAPLDPLGGSSYGASPVGGSTTGGGATGDDSSAPLIVKTESETVYGASSEAEAMRAALPPEPTAHALDATSAVLISDVPPVVPIAPIAPIVVSETIVSPMIEETTPVASEAPLVSDGLMSVPETPLVVSVPAIESAPESPNLFESIMSTPVEAPAPVIEDKIEVSQEPLPSLEDFSTPRAFIEKSLASVALMLANIDRRYSAKKDEEEGYRKEKMRFAELEKNAYVESEIMTREREHAVRMQKMFEAELETDSTNRNAKIAEKDAHEAKEKNTHKKHHEEKAEAIAA